MWRNGGFGMRGYGQGVYGFRQNGLLGFLPLAVHLIFFIFIVGLIIFLLRRHSVKVQKFNKKNDPALKILRERYALGEIDTDEFDRRKQDLAR